MREFVTRLALACLFPFVFVAIYAMILIRDIKEYRGGETDAQ